MPAVAVPSAVETVTSVGVGQEPPGGVGTVNGSGQPAAPSVRFTVMVAVPAFSATSNVPLLNSITPPRSLSTMVTVTAHAVTRPVTGSTVGGWTQASPSMVAPVGLLKTTVKDSSPSKMLSSVSTMSNVFTLSPGNPPAGGANVSVPLVAA